MNIPGVMAGVTAGGLSGFNGAETFAEENLRRVAENREGKEVRPLEVKTPEAPQTILKFATADEIAHVQSFSERIKTASAEVARIEKALYDNTRALNHAKSRSTDRSAELAARALGEAAQAPPSVTPQSMFDLESARQGLEVRLSEARAVALAATGQRKAAYADLLKICGERAKARYQALANELGDLHQAMATAQTHLPAGALLDAVIWPRLFVPAPCGRTVDTHYGVPVLASGDYNPRREERSQRELKRRTAELFGEVL